MKNKTIVSSPIYLVATKTVVDVAVATIVACLWLFDPFNRIFKGTGIDLLLGNDKMAKGELIAPRHFFTYSWMVILATSFISLPIWRRLDPCVSSRATVRKCAPSCKGDPDWHVLLFVLLVDLIAVLSCCIVLLAFRYIFLNRPFVSFGFVLIWGTVLVSIVFAIRLSMELGAMLFDGEKAMLSYLPEDVGNALRECGYAVTTSASSVLGSISTTTCGKSGDSSVILGAQGNNVPRTLGKLVVYNAQSSNILISAAIAFFIGMRVLVMYLSSKRSSRIGAEEAPDADAPAIPRRSGALDTTPGADKAAAESGDDEMKEKSGDDKAAAESGDDEVKEKAGDDQVNAESGDDQVNAESGDDEVTLIVDEDVGLKGKNQPSEKKRRRKRASFELEGEENRRGRK